MCLVQYRRYDILVTPHVSVGLREGVASPFILHTSPERGEARRANQTTDRGETPGTDRGVAPGRGRKEYRIHIKASKRRY